MLQVTLVHLYQAGMFADLDQIDAAPRIAASGDKSQGSASWTGIKVSAAEAPLKESNTSCSSCRQESLTSANR